MSYCINAFKSRIINQIDTTMMLRTALLVVCTVSLLSLLEGWLHFQSAMKELIIVAVLLIVELARAGRSGGPKAIRKKMSSLNDYKRGMADEKHSKARVN